MKPMTFEQAKRKLARIAKGEYHSLDYDLTFPSRKYPGPVEAKCTVYIYDVGMYDGPTWEAAFILLRAGGNRRKKRKADARQQP